MEGLILLIGEFLLAPLIAGILVLVELIQAIVTLLLHLIFGIQRKPNSGKPPKRVTLPPGALKWIRRVTLGTLSLFVTALLLLNFVFLEPAARFVADQVEAKTGIEIEYGSIEGNLFRGTFAFTRLELDQTTPEKAQFHIAAEALEVDLPVLRLILGERAIHTAMLADATIDYQIPEPPKETKTEGLFHIGAQIVVGEKGIDGVTVGTGARLLDAPKYRIDHLTLKQVNIQVTDRSTGKPTDYHIAIDHFEASPLRSHFAVFDLLFRSNLDAQLNGSELKIVNNEKDGMRQTRWATLAVQADVLASLIGGPFALFDGGLVDVEINDRWEAERAETVLLDWEIRVKEAHARLPDSVPTALKPLARVWAKHINENPKDWKFGFQLELSEARFHGAASLHAKQIWENTWPVILKQIAEYTQIKESVIQESAGKTLDRFKGFLEERRQ